MHALFAGMRYFGSCLPIMIRSKSGDVAKLVFQPMYTKKNELQLFVHELKVIEQRGVVVADVALGASTSSTGLAAKALTTLENYARLEHHTHFRLAFIAANQRLLQLVARRFDMLPSQAITLGSGLQLGTLSVFRVPVRSASLLGAGVGLLSTADAHSNQPTRVVDLFGGHRILEIVQRGQVEAKQKRTSLSISHSKLPSCVSPSYTSPLISSSPAPAPSGLAARLLEPPRIMGNIVTAVQTVPTFVVEAAPSNVYINYAGKFMMISPGGNHLPVQGTPPAGLAAKCRDERLIALPSGYKWFTGPNGQSLQMRNC